MSKLSLTRRAIVVGFDDTTRASWNETLSRYGFVPIEFRDTREILDAYRNLDPGVLVLGFEPDNVQKAFLDDLADCPAPPPVLIARSEPTDQAARSDWTGYLEYIGDVDGDGGIQSSLERATRFREVQLSVARMNESYCQEWCLAIDSSGGLIDVCHFDSIVEFHSSNDLDQIIESP